MRNRLKINDYDFKCIAEEYQTNVTLLKVLCKVETDGKGGFLDNGRPIIHFEGQIFWRELIRIGINPEFLSSKYPNIVYPSSDTSKYRGGTSEYLRLSIAISINKNAALRSTSWGMFQVLGCNHSLCGESSINGFVEKISENEASQLRLTLNYIRNAGIMSLLNNHIWSEFAKLYNGPEYTADNYDEKLRDAYDQLTKI